MKLIAGLGNPGGKYKSTRHNAGFMALDFLAIHYGFDDFKTLDKGKSLTSRGEISGEKVILMKPQNFMNLSGIPIRALADYFRIDRKDVIVIYDEADIPFGTMRVRNGGSAGGHNGVKSLIEQLGGDDFTRIRLGIKPDIPFKGALEDYVLGKLNGIELASLRNTISEIPAVIDTILEDGIDVTMNKYN